MQRAETGITRYGAIARALAQRALGMAVDASAYRPRAGEVRVPMLVARPAAHLLLHEDGEGLRGELVGAAESLAQHVDRAKGDAGLMPRVTDGAGHWREVYEPLLLHLWCSAVALGPPPEASLLGTLRSLVALVRQEHTRDCGVDFAEVGSGSRAAGALWRGLAVLEVALLSGDIDTGLDALGVIGRVADAPGPGGALHAQTPNDTPDAWVYRELTGLHALHLAAQVTRDPGWAVRCRQVAGYHVEHTQPDYTTYQPWGFAAFAEDASTASFAEQQLHDVQSHLAVEGAGGALLPGLLLADAVASLDGRMAGGWSRLRFQG